MALLLELTVVFLSAVVVLLCANYAVRSAIALAHHFKLSDVTIGMTVLAIGTSLPEIITHVAGSYRILKEPSLLNEVSGLVIGTNVGSDIFQQNFVLGLIAVIGVVAVSRKRLLPDMGGLIGAAILLLIVSFNGLISRGEGAFLLLVYIAYLFYLRKWGTVEQPEEPGDSHMGMNLFTLCASFVIMSFAAEFMVEHSVALASALPISASLFGVVLLGVTTAFPEITTALIGMRKGHAKISAGVLIGSNVTNPMFALGLGALMSSYTVPSVVVWYDLPIKIISALLILYFLWDSKMKKHEAIILILTYFAYLYFRTVLFPVDVL